MSRSPPTMDTYQNLQYIYNKAAYPRRFFYSDRNRRDSAATSTLTELNTTSNAQLTSTSTDMAAPSISEDDSYRKGTGRSIAERLQASSIETGVVLAGMLATSALVGLAIWAAATARAELHGDDSDAEDDANAAAIHFEKFGRLWPPSLDVNRLETTENGTSSRKMSVITRPPPQRKSHSLPLSHEARGGPTRITRRGGRDRDLGKLATSSVYVIYTKETVAPWSSESEDTPVAPAQRRVGGRRHLPANKSGRRSVRRDQNKRAHQRRRVQQ